MPGTIRDKFVSKAVVENGDGLDVQRIVQVGSGGYVWDGYR